MLLGNYNIFNNNPGRAVGGVTDPVNKFKEGSFCLFYHVNEMAQDTGTGLGKTLVILNKSAFNNGYNPPYSYVPAMKPGGMAATGTIVGSGTLAGSLAMGLNCAANVTGTGTLEGNLSVITSLASALTGSGTLVGALVTTSSFAASLTGSGSLAGKLGMLVGLSASLTGSGTLVGNLKRLASLEATISSSTELSPENLANAVLNAVVEGGYTVEDILKLLSAVAAGKTTIIDLGGGDATVTFRDIEDTRNAVVADMTGSERTTVTITN